MPITNDVNHQLISIELDVEELEEILAPTPSIPIPPPVRFH